MADQKQNSEFLGGGPKFNVVGKDNRPQPGIEEPIIVPNLAGYRLRVAGIVLVILALAAFLFYLNERNLGKTVIAPTRNGQAVSPDAKNAPVPTNLQ